MRSIPQLSWSQLTGWCSECYQRFGSIHNLPIRTIGAVTLDTSRFLEIALWITVTSLEKMVGELVSEDTLSL